MYHAVTCRYGVTRRHVFDVLDSLGEGYKAGVYLELCIAWV
jgi:hypothetical protein